MFLNRIIFGFYSIFSLGIIRSILKEVHPKKPVVITISLILLGILVFLFILKEINQIKKHKVVRRLAIKKMDLITIMAVVSGAYLTFILNHAVGMGGVLASSVVGLVAAYTIKGYAFPIYCGSFVGMAHEQIYSAPLTIGIASLIAGILYVISSHIFAGWGGRAGFFAFVGGYITSLFIDQPFHFIEPLDFGTHVFIFLATFLASIFTFLIQTLSNQFNAVSASAFIGLIVVLFSSDPSHVIVFAAFCGTFTGMTSQKLFMNKSDIIIASFFTAFLFIFSFTLFEGVGGKLGSLAFVASIATGGLKLLLSFLKNHPILIKTNKYIRTKWDTD